MTKFNLKNLFTPQNSIIILAVMWLIFYCLGIIIMSNYSCDRLNKKLAEQDTHIKLLNESIVAYNEEVARLLAKNNNLENKLFKMSPTLVGEDWVEHDDSNAFGSTPRSPKWPTVRAKFICDGHDKCFVCCTTDDLNVHHIKPFHEHPELELDPNNLITLCRKHHFTIGHDPDYTGPERPSWSKSNPNVKRDAIKAAKKLNPEWEECK